MPYLETQLSFKNSDLGELRAQAEVTQTVTCLDAKIEFQKLRFGGPIAYKTETRAWVDFSENVICFHLFLLFSSFFSSLLLAHTVASRTHFVFFTSSILYLVSHLLPFFSSTKNLFSPQQKCFSLSQFNLCRREALVTLLQSSQSSSFHMDEGLKGQFQSFPSE